MSKKPFSDDVSIGKFDMLATYTYVDALLHGVDDDEAKQRGMVAAIMGAKIKLGHTEGVSEEAREIQKNAAEQKKKTTITADSFDHQVSDKMGDFFVKTFLPAMKKLVESGLSYDEVKQALKIPATWGAKINGETFKERALKFLSKG